MQSMTKQEVFELIENKLSVYFGTSFAQADRVQLYKATAMAIRDLLLERFSAFKKANAARSGKRVYYLCLEFLVGRSLQNNLFNLSLIEPFEQLMEDHDIPPNDLYDLEPDAGLGNGGLGRLAACYMDALATMSYPAVGFSIRYEYGLFRQKIVDGWQMELPDIWLPRGEVWLTPRTDDVFKVRFDGIVEEQWTEQGLKVHHKDYKTVEAIPYDMMISGADSNGVGRLRLWHARDDSRFDMHSFASGDYTRATLENTNADMISKVLYPSDNHFEGKSLRLKQQYFMVSASVQNIVKDHIRAYGGPDHFAEKNAIHINDTHPALCIPELMRIFMDEYGFDWDTAFDTVVRSVTYTNHTVLSEALELWPEDLIARRLPRIYAIIKEINRRYCEQLWSIYPGDWDRIERMAVISGSQIRMANLAVVGSNKVNGVSAMHAEIIKEDVFKDFYEVTPEKFTGVTNGIAHRRWLCQANRGLTDLLDDCIGPAYRHDAEKLSEFARFSNDVNVRQRLETIKIENKRALCDVIKDATGKPPDPNSLFSVQAKRLHEYKRQLMNALRIIALYQDLLDNPNLFVRPKTFLFAAKAAPGYDMAKQIIKLIHYIGVEIDQTPKIREQLRVIFLENYSATLAEHLLPAADISEQISLAGKEASGTGNMKLMMNGAITVGTMDGANIEISEAVGKDNIFIFGMDDKQVEDEWNRGYAPTSYYQHIERLKRAVDRLKTGFAGVDFTNIYQYLMVGEYGIADPYMCMADFEDYVRVHEQADQAYEDKPRWNSMSLMNIAKSGRFSADRSVKEYADDIWGITPVDMDDQ